MKGKTRIYLAKSLNLFLIGCMSLGPTGLIFAQETPIGELTTPTTESENLDLGTPQETIEIPTETPEPTPTLETEEDILTPTAEDPSPIEETVPLEPEVEEELLEELLPEEESLLPEESTSSSFLEEEGIVNSFEARNTAGINIIPKPDNASGAFVYEVPIEVPPGRMCQLSPRLQHGYVLRIYSMEFKI